MTSDLTPIHSNATDREADETIRMSPLVQGVFGVMSGEFNVTRLAEVLGANKRPVLESLGRDSLLSGARLSFKNANGIEDLSLSLKHNEKASQLIVEVKTPSGLMDREAIASHVHSILKGATNNQIPFKGLVEALRHETSSTDNSPINYRGSFDVPKGLDVVLLEKAGLVFAREEEAQIAVDRFLDQLFRRAQPKDSSGMKANRT